MAQVTEWTLLLREALRQAILREARSEDPVQVLAAAGRTSDRLVAYLESLIGVAGTRALLLRSRTLTLREHPSFDGARAPAGAPPPAPGVALEAQLAALVTFVNLLVSFIGERLTVQVLGHLWPEVGALLRQKEESP